MENKLRIIRCREFLPFPTISPHESRIENKKDKDKILHEVDKEVTEMLITARDIELNYEKEKEAKNKEQQAGMARQTNRLDFNASTVNASTPIKNNNTALQTGTSHHQKTDIAVTFNSNPVCHLYPTTDQTNRNDWYELPANDSIIHGAASIPVSQFTTHTTNMQIITNHGDTTTRWIHPHAQTTRHTQLIPPVAPVSTIICLTPWTNETAPNATDAENKAI